MEKVNTIQLGNRLTQLREEAGEKQSDLAKLLGYNSHQQISYFENGQRQLTIHQIAILARHYNVSADYLLGLTDVKSNDIEIKAVCDYTGLNEKAIDSLQNCHDYNLDFFSNLIISFNNQWRFDFSLFDGQIYFEKYVKTVSKLVDVFINNNNSNDDITPKDYEINNKDFISLEELDGGVSLAKYRLTNVFCDFLNNYFLSSVNLTLSDYDDLEEKLKLIEKKYFDYYDEKLGDNDG